MSEEPTQNLPSLSFEERVLSEFAAMRTEFAAMRTEFTAMRTEFGQELAAQREMITQLNTRMTSLEDRVLSIDVRLISLEEKVDARLRETRPIWEGVQQRLTEIEKSVTTISRHFKTMVSESFDLRSRLEKLEDSQPMP